MVFRYNVWILRGGFPHFRARPDVLELDFNQQEHMARIPRWTTDIFILHYLEFSRDNQFVTDLDQVLPTSAFLAKEICFLRCGRREWIMELLWNDKRIKGIRQDEMLVLIEFRVKSWHLKDHILLSNQPIHPTSGSLELHHFSFPNFCSSQPHQKNTTSL